MSHHENSMIAPHGGTLINRIVDGQARERLLEETASLPKVPVDAFGRSDVEMLAIGGFSPLEGFMTQRDYESVVTQRRLANGLVWTIPITLAVDQRAADSLKPGTDVALTDAEHVIAILHLEACYRPDKAQEATHVFGTDDVAHPSVQRLRETGDVYLGGRISVVNRPQADTFQAYRLDPAQTRETFATRGWRRIVAFQTRNPIHRAHEYIQKCALEICDGMLLHPIIGETKPGDLSAEVRMKSYEVLLRSYFPRDRVVLAVNPASMRYAGPREAIFHALVRKNYGCTHFIVGRDHAGVGKFYGTYDAQRIFDEFAPEEIGITPLRFEHTAYCTACGGMVSSKTCPHAGDQHVILSGTKVRELLSAGTSPPAEISRPEVAEVLIEALRGQSAARSSGSSAR